MKKIFVNSLPKSGTNLISQCLDLIGYRQIGGIDASMIAGNKVSSALRKLYHSTMFSDSYLVGIDMPVELSRWSVDRIINRVHIGEYATGHIGYSDKLLSTIKKAGFSSFLIIRDPRAVLNSFVYYVANSKHHPVYRDIRNLSEKERYRLALYGYTRGKTTLLPLLERCKSIDMWINDESVLVCKFENLVGPGGGGSTLAQDNELEKIIARANVTNIEVSDIKEKVFGPGRHTFRKGSSSGWREEMPVDIQKEVTDVVAEVISNWGYEDNP